MWLVSEELFQNEPRHMLPPAQVVVERCRRDVKEEQGVLEIEHGGKL